MSSLLNSPNKFGRALRNLRRFFSLDGFALGPVWAQLTAILGCSAVIILVMSPLVGSIATSYSLFVDPASYADTEGATQVFFGLLQMVLGLVLFSFVISVLSAALGDLIDRIRGGTLPYKKGDHLVVVHKNARLPLLLDEVAGRARRLGESCEVLLLLQDRAALNEVAEHFDFARWPELQISLRQGEVTDYETYRRIGLDRAFGVVVLASDAAQNVFLADNQNLKILACLTNQPDFMRHLEERQRAWRPVKCAVEVSSQLCSRDIALAMTRSGTDSLFAVINPDDVIVSVLSRSIIDIVYYKVYFELLSFHGHSVHFVSPERFRDAGVEPGLDYDSLLLGFQGGTLAGYSRTDAEGRFSLLLCPFGIGLEKGDWFLFITHDVGQIKYVPPVSPGAPLPAAAIRPPSEIIHRRLCLIGSAWPVENLDTFLDQESREALRASHFKFEDEADFFAPSFVSALKEGNYDNVVINLDDETGFRLTMHLISSCDADDPFLEKVVTVLSDPVIEGLLNANARYRNTVLSHKLASKYIAQISFQKSLEKFFRELARPEGVEFHLMRVGDDVPVELLTDAGRLRAELAARHIAYVGSVGPDRKVTFGAGELGCAEQLIVLSKGDC